jgi:flagellar biosynthetic protein FlhB
VLLQTGVLLNPAALRPQFSRINPHAGLKRLFGANGLVEAAKSCAKIAVIALIAWKVLAGDLAALLATPFSDAATLAARCARPVLHVVIAVLIAQAVIVVADVLWVRLRHSNTMRMSRQDVRDEQKETDGDPKVKLRFRQLRFKRARKRMLAAVPKATVVIINPTHYAVALVYDRAKNAAPRVVAKGVDEVAERIRDVAKAARVPLVSNPPLARALYRVELDTDIPAEHYKTVAEIIAYVWRLGRTATRPTARTAIPRRPAPL